MDLRFNSKGKSIGEGKSMLSWKPRPPVKKIRGIILRGIQYRRYNFLTSFKHLLMSVLWSKSNHNVVITALS